MKANKLKSNPMVGRVAAVSMGIVKGRAVLDLNYVEDKDATVDMNLVMNGSGDFVELQSAGEESTFTEDQLAALISLGKAGVRQLLDLQEAAMAAG